MKTTIAMLLILAAVFAARGTERFLDHAGETTPAPRPMVMRECHQLPPFL